MKKSFTKFTNLVLGGVIVFALASCYTFKRVVAPAEIAGNEAYDGRIAVVNENNNGTQTGLSFFAVRVPSNWNVTVDDKSYKQFAREGTLNDSLEEVNMERAMRYCSYLTDVLNITNPKDGYTWFAFQTKECIRRNIMGSDSQGADSICFDYKVINDGVAGEYVLDYMIGSFETNNPDTIDMRTITMNDLVGSDVCRVGTEQTNSEYTTGTFNNVVENMKTTVKVLEGGTPTDNSPRITATYNGGSVNVEYANMSGDIGVYKNAATIALPCDYTIVGDQKLNNGTYTLDGSAFEPGVYHFRSESTGTESTLTVPFTAFTPAESSLFVIGNTSLMAPELLVNDGTAFETSRVMDAVMYQQTPAIVKAMVDSILTVKPAAVLITGDLTKAGEKVSHELLTSILKPVTDAGIKVYVVPGDQDINNYEAASYDGDESIAAATVTPEEFAQIYGGFGYNDAVSRDENTLSYIAYPTDKLAVLALDACQYNNPIITTEDDGTTTIERNAKGELKQATLDWAAEAVRNAHASGRQVVAMMHHLVSAPFDGYASLGNIVNNREGLDLTALLGGGSTEETTEAKKAEGDELDTYGVQDALVAMGVDVVFVSDAKATDIEKVYTSEGKDLYQVATASATAYNCPFRLVNVADDKVDIQTRIINNLDVEGLEGMTFEDFAYYRTKNGIPAVVSQYTEANWETIHAFLLKSFTFDYDPEVDLFDKNAFFVLPETAEDGAKIVNENIVPPLVDVILSFVDGNENYKKSAEIVQGMHDGFDGAISAINTFPSIINPMVKDGFIEAGLDIDAMIDQVVGSIAYNYLEDTSNVTNDLFVTINLVNYDPTGINQVQTTSNTETTIYNVAGQKLNAPVKGINIINGKKVIIK